MNDSLGKSYQLTAFLLFLLFRILPLISGQSQIPVRKFDKSL